MEPLPSFDMSDLTLMYLTSKAIVGNVVLEPQLEARISSASLEQLVTSNVDSCITVYNASPKPQPFYVIAEPPIFSSDDKPTVYSPVYQSSDKVANGTGTANFVFPGTSAANPGPAIYIVTGRSRVDLAKVDLSKAPKPLPTDRKAMNMYQDDNLFHGSCCMVSMPDTYEPSFVQVQAEATIAKTLATNEVQVSVDDSFNYPGKGFPFVGIGVPHLERPNMILPVCIWEAIPSTKYTLQPSNKWTCFRGDLGAGRYGDLKQDSITSRITVDLRNSGVSSEVIYGKNGKFRPYDNLSLE